MIISAYDNAAPTRATYGNTPVQYTVQHTHTHTHTSPLIFESITHSLALNEHTHAHQEKEELPAVVSLHVSSPPVTQTIK